MSPAARFAAAQPAASASPDGSPGPVGGSGSAEARPADLPVVVLTTFFPTPRDPFRTPFLRNLVQALSGEAALDLVIPVPRRPPIGSWRDNPPVPARETHAGFEMTHPRYLAVPGLHVLSGLTYALAAWRGLRDRRRRGGPFVLHAHCAYPDGVGAALVARWLGVPLVITAHGSDINVSARSRLLRWQIRWALRSAARVVAVSAPLRAAIASLTRLPSAAIALVPCAGFSPAVFRPRGDAERAALRDTLGVPAGARLAVFVGHLFKVKALDVLLQAWTKVARVPGARRLVLIGEGDERAALEAQAAAAGITDSVSFLGPLPQAQVADWIAASDLLCLCSHSEGTPNVVVEALASGVPVVASRVGGIPDLVEEGVNARLVPPGDASALAAALVEMFELPREAGRIAATVQHLTWPGIARRNRDILADVARESSACKP